jgi:STAS domain
MADQDRCPPSVIVTLPAQINTANAEQAARQISASFTPRTTVVIADLTSTTCRDGSAIRHLLKAHRKAAVQGRQVRFAIRPEGPLHRITDFAGTHPLLAVYPTLQRAITGRSAKPPQRSRRPRRSPSPHRYL